MKNFLLSCLVLPSFTAVAAFVTWKVVGPPDRSVSCNPEVLPEHHVCLKTVREWPQEEVLWVDARPRKLWEQDGVENSVLVNDQEDWVDLEMEFMTRAFGDGTNTLKTVVVYCDQSGCSSSKYVADRLRVVATDLDLKVFVLEGGVKALRAEAAR